MADTRVLKTSRLLVLISLAGCNATPDPASSALLQASANRSITCQAGADCAEKWSRASSWIAQNSDYKIQTASESVIQTMGPLPSDPSPAFTVTKSAETAGVYRIVLNGGCDNIFGCIPNVLESKAKFANYVDGGNTPPPTAQPTSFPHGGKNIGLKVIPVPQPLAASLKVSPGTGLLVALVEPGGLSEISGLLKGDVILSSGRKRLVSNVDLQAVLNSSASNHHITFNISRQGAPQQINVAY